MSTERTIKNIMNESEYMLNKLSQECIEVSREISNALEFGLDNYNPDDKDNDNSNNKISNKSKVESELNDLLGVLDMVTESNLLNINKIACSNGREKKIEKVNKCMGYARKAGTLI